ncbi:MAG: glycosyltransferase family 39 protein, partial [bacterium]|nr:glycosyltransferase family 39 protein [bacterium]
MKKLLAATAVLILVFLVTRFYNLTLMPIFTDEAIYVRWAQIANYDASWRFISLTDGKQPLFIWLMMDVMPIFGEPLFAGRAASILAGLGTMAGLFFLGKEIFKSKKVGWLAMLLYFLYPFALVYDRMALMDGLVGMFAVWALLFEILLVKTLRL